MRRLPILVSTVAVAAVLATSLSGCASSGDQYASSVADAVAAKFGESISPPEINDRTADYLVSASLPSLNRDDGDTRVAVEALSWKGRTGSGDGAEIDIRVVVTVDEHVPTTFNDRSRSAGSITRCYHLAAIGYRYYDRLQSSTYPCPTTAAPPAPSAVPLPALPTDTMDRLTVALESTDAQKLQRDVSAAFPGGGVTVKTASANGELIAAVGLPAERDCVVAVRRPSGVARFSDYDPIQLMPGETGCSPELYLHPAN